MGKRSWHGLIWSLVTVVWLLSFMTPLLPLTIGFLMVPVLMLYVKTTTRSFILYYVGSLLVVYLLSALQGLFLISISLFFLPPVLAMGSLYKRKAAARTVLTAGTVTLLGESLLSLMISALSGLNPIGSYKAMMNDYFQNIMQPALKQMLGSDQDLYLNAMVQWIPTFLIMMAVFYVFVSHGLSRWLLNKTGESIPGLRPMREWMLPRTFVWLYLLALILGLFIPTSTSMVSTILQNLLPLLIFVFTIQALAFLYYIIHQKGWNRALPFTATALLAIMWPLMFVYSLLGVVDVAFPIRERFKKNM
ncbi:DUF2232 domain-containing protein [Paenibacillus athensensis]|uniref:DUF2232 domain-containing protein n=1 Tax=Paenibacillus athensensis TaxID=1967502 RepID=UPI001E4C2ED8|nr:DUF2232 domain-containing protein [Paenibacillus athensensis]